MKRCIFSDLGLVNAESHPHLYGKPDYHIDFDDNLVESLRALLGSVDQQLRLLLLCRVDVQWWDEAYRTLNRVGQHSPASFAEQPSELMPLAMRDVREKQHRATSCQILKSMAKRAQLRMPDAQAASAYRVPLGDATPLAWMMHAYLFLHGDTVPDSASELCAQIVDVHEVDYIKKKLGVSSRADLWKLEAARDALALITLAGGAREAQFARALISAVPGIRSGADAVFDALHNSYQRAEGIDALRPDLLGEYLCETRLGENPGLSKAFVSTLVEWVKDAESHPHNILHSRLAPLLHADWLCARVKTWRAGTALLDHLHAALAELSFAELQALIDADVHTHPVFHSLRERILNRQRERAERDSLDAARTLNKLALLYQAQVRYSEAEPLYLEDLRISRKQLGDQHPDVATSLNNLAMLYRAQGRYSEAEPLYGESLAIRRKKLGDQHPRVATSLNNLAELYRAQGRYSEAEPLYAESLAILRKQLGDQHPHVASSLNNLAMLYESQGGYSEAEPLLDESLAIRRKQLGDQHPDVAASLNNLAVLYESQGRYSEAEPLYVEAISICERGLGADHPNTRTAKANLAALREKTKERGGD